MLNISSPLFSLALESFSFPSHVYLGSFEEQKKKCIVCSVMVLCRGVYCSNWFKSGALLMFSVYKSALITLLHKTWKVEGIMLVVVSKAYQHHDYSCSAVFSCDDMIIHEVMCM